ncbi:hypothetical protein [Nostoc sp. WHI]|uniref:hypothetical protein n=1 Tax=Nostoc sp. WHI TaxID=2650611 RepID=UPI0018C791F8|nr:hypothetical protein [Nostoc sp. WHI]
MKATKTIDASVTLPIELCRRWLRQRLGRTQKIHSLQQTSKDVLQSLIEFV